MNRYEIYFENETCEIVDTYYNRQVLCDSIEDVLGLLIKILNEQEERITLIETPNILRKLNGYS